MSGYKSYDSFAHVNDIGVFDFLIEKIETLKNDFSSAFDEVDVFFEDNIAELQSYLDYLDEQFEFYKNLVWQLEKELDDLYDLKQEYEYDMYWNDCDYDYDDYNLYDDEDFDDYDDFDDSECEDINSQIEAKRSQLSEVKEKKSNVLNNLNRMKSLIDTIKEIIDKYYYFEERDLTLYFEQDLGDAIGDLTSDKNLLERYINTKIDL